MTTVSTLAVRLDDLLLGYLTHYLVRRVEEHLRHLPLQKELAAGGSRGAERC